MHFFGPRGKDLFSILSWTFVLDCAPYLFLPVPISPSSKNLWLGNHDCLSRNLFVDLVGRGFLRMFTRSRTQNLTFMGITWLTNRLTT